VAPEGEICELGARRDDRSEVNDVGGGSSPMKLERFPRGAEGGGGSARVVYNRYDEGPMERKAYWHARIVVHHHLLRK
jgi:hypothetical protein